MPFMDSLKKDASVIFLCIPIISAAINKAKTKDCCLLLKFLTKTKNTIPLFLKDKKGALTIISSFNKNTDDTAIGFTLVYLGKPINTQEKQDKE